MRRGCASTPTRFWKSSLSAAAIRPTWPYSTAQILFIDRARSLRGGRGKLKANARAGSRLPAYCTSMGKVLLAYLPVDQRLRLISEMELTQHAPKTIASSDALREELERIREEGLAVGDEELVTGSSAIAAPVRDGSGEVVAAANLVVHDGMLGVDELVDEFGGQIIATAERISTRLGWHGES